MADRDANKYVVRFPAGMRQWLAEQAAWNASSVNSEIVRAVRERMDRVAASLERRSKAAGKGPEKAVPAASPDHAVFEHGAHQPG